MLPACDAFCRADLGLALRAAVQPLWWLRNRRCLIVDSLTLLTKADVGLVQLESRPVRLDELVEESFEDAQHLALPHDVTVTMDDCDEVTVSGDRHRLRQLLLILTDNAVKYNRPRGTLSISLRNISGTAELRITNTGGSIAPKTLEKIFERFVRGENAQGKVEGSGLGLAIAQWIVRAHGGSIQLLSEPGEKFTALVKIPVIPAAGPVRTKAI